MSRGQNSYRGRIEKEFVVAGTVDINQQMEMTANSTGIVVADFETALPSGVDNGRLFGFISNSTGFAIFLNSTATTYKYLLTTSVQPT